MKLFCFLLLFTQSAYASYFLVPATSAQLNPLVRTHIVIAGRGNDLGFAPEVAASAKVKMLMTAYPRDQVLFISTSEYAGNENDIIRMGYSPVNRVNALLDPKRLMDEVSTYTQIASFHVYGHSAIPEGAFLDQQGGHDIRWYPTDPQPDRLIGHFTEDAFATFNGCNLGHVMASLLSKKWGIPVAGALVGTHFEALFQDGNYYWADPGTQNQWSTSCNGTCYRMRPDNSSYHGHYGSYLQGLPFYKFFCVGISEEKCLTAMARSIYSTVSTQVLTPKSTLQDYARVVREWLCPTYRWGDSTQKGCMNRLENIDVSRLTPASPDQYYTPFGGPTAQCDFISCYSQPKCQDPKNTLWCAQNLPSPGMSTTFMDEYMAYLRGYQLLVHSPTFIALQ